MHEEHRPAFHAYRRFFLVCISMLMIIGGLLIWVWNGPGSALVKSAPPFAIERQVDGSWPSIPNDTDGFMWSLDVSKRESKTNFTSNQSASSATGARIASRSIAVLNTSNEALADLVARGVIAGLQLDPEIQRISYAPKNGTTPVGELAPDIVITIAVGNHQEDTMAGSGTMNSKVSVTMSDQVARGLSYTMRPNQAPHRVHFRMALKSTTDVEQDGIATPNARLKAAAKDLSKGILDRLRDSIDKLRSEHGIFPELPATFYPDYRLLDESQFDVRTVYAANEPYRLVASWRDRFAHNITWWHGVVAGTEDAAIARISARLQEAGFTLKEPDNKYDHTFRKGSHEVELIPNQIRHTSDAETPTKLHVRYTHQADAGIRSAALDSIINDGSSPELLMMCSPAWNGEQRTRGIALIDAIDLQDPACLMQRAALRKLADDDAGAADDLARAAAYSRTSFGRDKTLENARKKAEEWEITFEDKLDDRDWLLSFGMLELVAGADPIEIEVTPGAPLRGVAFHNGHASTVAIGLIKDKLGQWGGASRVVSAADSQYSGLPAGISRHQIQQHTLSIEFLEDPAHGQARVRIMLR
ncbi:MAG: hypothetical protein ACJAQZ_005046 [Planctomycetota bacterium]|jgi:hypothetical protein